MAELKNRSVKKTIDGNEAAAHVSYAFTEVAGIYPITPSSNMAEHVDLWAANGRKNIFGQPVRVIEMQSEAGAAGTVHGSLQAGALTTTYTASQGLLLMIPNMYKIAGELLPGVLHVSARAVAGHALSIYGDHSDVMACRQTGFAMLASSNAQEVMDIGAVAHLASIKSRVPFLHFFDGFRTSHEIQKIDALDYDDLAEIADHDAIRKFRDNALNPEHPVTRGTAQNPDVFFQAKEASNPFYDAVPAIVEQYMEKINKLTGRNYKLFDYYGAEDAEHVVVAMGSAADTIKETIDYLNEKQGRRLGLVNVHLYRPFSAKHLLQAIPDTCAKICVLDRCKEPGAPGEPLYLDVVAAFTEMNVQMEIICGRYGLGSKDVTPAQIVAVFDNMTKLGPKNHFTVGIKDDVTNLSLEVGAEIDITPEGTTSCKFWGLGADGTVGANTNSIRIIGDHTDMYAQAYFSYDSKKSGGVTQSHLRFGKKPIRSPYLVKTADFVACHNQSYIDKYDMIRDLKEGGTFLLNCMWSPEELEDKLPGAVKRAIASKKIKFYTIDATTIARSIGLGNRVNTTLQSAFFKLADIIPIDEAVKFMKDEIAHTYIKRGENVVKMNCEAVDRGLDGFVQVKVPAEWANAPDTKFGAPEVDDEFVQNVAFRMNYLHGESLPVSTFKGREDGSFPMGTSQYEKRSIAVDIPRWIPENCIQCNQCSYVCPHATIRPFLLKEDEKKEGMATLKATGKGFEDYQYRLQIAPEDCPGCGNCVQVCPAKEKALVMEPLASQQHEIENWEYCIHTVGHKENPGTKETVKGSQFEQPLLEFSGACTGCGETPYCKLITQLFGDRMYIANATGCSSIWGASAPSTPYTTNKKGHGPAWQNSLFEDNAEFGYGIMVGVKQRRELLKMKAEKLIAIDWATKELKEALQKWVSAFNDGEASKAASAELAAALEDAVYFENGNFFQGEYAKYWDKVNKWCVCDACMLAREMLAEKDVFVKKSVWVFGGDGWAYDIGFGGLDHVLASGEDINILVMDTEVYSNTGGQASKSTPTAATAKFAASGKKIRKKDLGMMAASYGYVYVAQVCMGYDQNHVLKCMLEAEKYDGPSMVIAYAPCIAHGMASGMGRIYEHSKKAVEAGYWHCWSYNPELADEGKNPFVMRSKEPTGDFKEFITSESRYTALQTAFPDIADQLFDQAALDAKARYESYKKMAD
ncbi:MAG: pyruvate:ferredoxin (flavodoxin) oxidoreductase [Defluviitaleaceae bacterium]|nr:pyruvate:ferredoxin (flavodoxin) oxidoreductase [Defluviitaleaceae bacterium]MCL2835160.1 pyruvate:ferredoxin (flavodoxin) oxidoreductase [Defluviitaleaceae bacterium]